VWWLALAQAPEGGDGVDEIMQRLAALDRLRADMDGRLSSAGLGGAGSAIDLARRLKLALDEVSADELLGAQEGIGRLHRMLAELSTSLDEILRIKTALG
jgi:hypothetical protein